MDNLLPILLIIGLVVLINVVLKFMFSNLDSGYSKLRCDQQNEPHKWGRNKEDKLQCEKCNSIWGTF